MATIKRNAMMQAPASLPASRVSQLPAHYAVSARQATRAEAASGTEWPVSGDESRLAYGYMTMRQAGRKASVWRGVELLGVFREMERLELACTGCVDPINHPHSFDCRA